MGQEFRRGMAGDLSLLADVWVLSWEDLMAEEALMTSGHDLLGICMSGSQGWL